METPFLRRLGMGAFSRPTTVLTSRPYAVVAPVDSMGSSFVSTTGGYIPNEEFSYLEPISSSFIDIEGELRSVFQEYTEYEPEGFETSFADIEGDLRQILKTYDNYEAEAITSSFSDITGDMAQILVTYDNYEAEAIESSFVSVSGDLT